MFSLNLLFYSLLTLLALTASCTAVESKLASKNSSLSIVAATTVVESIQTQSFAAWCQRKTSVPPATRHTIDVLLKIAKTNDCKSADDRLRDYILRYGGVLDLRNKKISDLKPISGLTQATAIYLSNNQIRDLQPLANLRNVYNAQLDNNQISDLRPLAMMSRLSSLNLENNRIADVSPLAALSASMRELILNKNQITDLSSLRVLRKLEQLHARNNPLVDKTCPLDSVATGVPTLPVYSVCRLD